MELLAVKPWRSEGVAASIWAQILQAQAIQPDPGNGPPICLLFYFFWADVV